MLLFWVCASVLTAAVVLALTRPLVAAARSGTRIAETGGADANVAVYRDQLAEIDADKARGLVSEAEAEAARIEVARRLIASAGPAESTGRAHPNSDVEPPDSHPAERMFWAVAGSVPAVALGLYLTFGSPGLPGLPFAQRLATAPTAATGVDELIARVEARLRTNPTDGEGWDVIAPVYLRLERFHEAADAWRRALDLLGETPRRLSGYAESTVLANDGIVTEPARKAYERLLVLDPSRFDARFGIALAREQEGDIDTAEAMYHKLIEEAPVGAPWRQFVGERIDAIEARRGGGGKGQDDAQKGPRPGAAETAAISGLPEDQRRQVILGMVESLAARLKANGRDADGWQRLIRSWSVLGDKAKAEAVLGEALKALAGDAKAQAEMEAFARSIGLKS